jgi:CarD family transcriptional regulator
MPTHSASRYGPASTRIGMSVPILSSATRCCRQPARTWPNVEVVVGGEAAVRVGSAEGSPLLFEVGETVVYPHHGAATIVEVKKRIIRGEEKLYLKLNVTQGDLVIEVPAENVDLVGVRDVIGQEGVEAVFAVLRAPFAVEPTNWSRRYKANLEKLASGDVIKVSEVVRDLWRRDQDRGLSAGEKRMLLKARQILIGELALAEKTDEERAGIVLDEVLAS